MRNGSKNPLRPMALAVLSQRLLSGSKRAKRTISSSRINAKANSPRQPNGNPLIRAKPSAARPKPPALIAPSSPTANPLASALTSSTSITIAIEPSAAEKVTVRNFSTTKLGAFYAKAVSPLKQAEKRDGGEQELA